MQVIDIVDGPLSKEEFDLITLALHGPTATAIAEDDEKEKFEEIAKHFVRWRCDRVTHACMPRRPSVVHF